MVYRYYIGLSLPRGISQQITAIQQELFDGRFVIEPLEPHITLLPPPAVETINPDKLATLARDAAAPFWPLQLTCSHIEHFGAKAVAVGVTSPAIHQLQEVLSRLLPPDAQPAYFPNPQFTPHITLAQSVRGHTLPAELVSAYKQAVTPLLSTTVTAHHLTLYRWLRPRTYHAEQL